MNYQEIKAMLVQAGISSMRDFRHLPIDELVSESWLVLHDATRRGIVVGPGYLVTALRVQLHVLQPVLESTAVEDSDDSQAQAARELAVHEASYMPEDDEIDPAIAKQRDQELDRLDGMRASAIERGQQMALCERTINNDLAQIHGRLAELAKANVTKGITSAALLRATIAEIGLDSRAARAVADALPAPKAARGKRRA